MAAYRNDSTRRYSPSPLSEGSSKARGLHHLAQETDELRQLVEVEGNAGASLGISARGRCRAPDVTPFANAAPPMIHRHRFRNCTDQPSFRFVCFTCDFGAHLGLGQLSKQSVRVGVGQGSLLSCLATVGGLHVQLVADAPWEGMHTPTQTGVRPEGAWPLDTYTGGMGVCVSTVCVPRVSRVCPCSSWFPHCVHMSLLGLSECSHQLV